jgi:hypothetical protein
MNVRLYRLNAEMISLIQLILIFVILFFVLQYAVIRIALRSQLKKQRKDLDVLYNSIVDEFEKRRDDV